MRLALLFALAGTLPAQQPILYNRGTVNAASLAPFGLPNAPIARGSVFSVFGENLGPAQSPALAFPLSTTLGGVSISVTQATTTQQAYPIFVSPGQVNAIMPSSVTAGLATLRLTYQSRSNAITIEIRDAVPGLFAVSSGGYGPGIVQNFVSSSLQPINSLAAPAAPGQYVTLWGTGLGPVTFPDNVAPTVGNIATPVSVTVGGQTATIAYAGRTPCCSGIDQITVTVPQNAPLGCWVPVTVNAGGVVSNTVTMAIAPSGATACDDAGNPLSKLVRTPGTQAYLSMERWDDTENVNHATPTLKTIDSLYARFYTRPASPFSFDPYLSNPPAGTCTVHQTSGDSLVTKSLRGALPASASLSPQPALAYNNGTQSLPVQPNLPYFASAFGAVVDSTPDGMNLLGPGANLTIDPAGPNQFVLPLSAEAPPGWTRPAGILVVPRNSPLSLSFTPGDTAAPTVIEIYSYAAVTNSTVEVVCLAAPGTSSFLISADNLSNLPPTYGVIDGSYSDLIIGTLAINHATSFTNALAANGILVSSSWHSQSVVLQ